MRLHHVLVLAAAPLFAAAPAFGLTQPDGAVIPSPMGCANNEPPGLEAVMACACTMPGVCNIGAPCPGGSVSCDNGQNGTCEATIWHSPNDNSCIPSNESGLNVATQGLIVPAAFHPTCGQTFTVLSRGTARFEDVFGWYNVKASGAAPDPSDLHVMVQCTDAAGTAATLDVTQDPAYLGGDIGFFLLTPEDHTQHGTCAGSNCCPSVASFESGQGYVYYSQRELNPDFSSMAPYIHLLILPGAIAPHRYYFGWEDTFDTTSADFTDLVMAVDGVECSGAGVSCSTGKEGACALGVTVCSTGSTMPTCQELVSPEPEKCNGVDDNCDGLVDNGATCPAAGDICVNGACVPQCSSENFCDNGLACEDGLCVGPSCVGVSCSADQICRSGKCETACSGVVCPHGQTCLNDACVNLCAGVTCPAGDQCDRGVCFSGCKACGGVTCASPLSCDETSGSCVDPSCASACPAGTYCSSGACVDACAGASCPGGAACKNGQCGSPGSPPVADAGTPGKIASPEPSGVDGGAVVDRGADGGVGSGASGTFPSASTGCGCTAVGSARGPARSRAGMLLVVALAGMITRRRSRRVRAG